MTWNEVAAIHQKTPVREFPNRCSEIEPLVSVLLVTYNHGRFIRQSLDGIMMQQASFPFEVIIAEDDSSDDTRDICIEYANKYPEKVRLLLNSRENNIHINGRPSGRFNFLHALSKTRGKYVAWCEGDDYWTDSLKLQKQADFLEANGQYAISYHDTSIADDSGSIIASSKLGDKRKRDYTTPQMMMGRLIPTNSVMFRNVLKNIPPQLLQSTSADSFVFTMVAHHGHAHFQSNVLPSVYRVHNTSYWSSVAPVKQVKSNIDTYKYIKEAVAPKYRPLIKTKIFESHVKWMETEQGVANKLRAYVSSFSFLALDSKIVKNLLYLHKRLLKSLIK